MRKYLMFSLFVMVIFLAQANADIPMGEVRVLMVGFRNDKGKVRVALFNAANGFPIYQKRAYKVIITAVKNKTSEVVFTHAPESHGCKPVDEWLSVRGYALRNPVEKEATAVKPWSFTRYSLRDICGKRAA